MQSFEQRVQSYCQGFRKRLELQGVGIPNAGFLAGNTLPAVMLPFRDPSVDIGWDNSHFPFPYGFVLEEGLPGIVARAEKPVPGLEEKAVAYRKGVADIYNLLLDHINRHLELAKALQKEYPSDPRYPRIAANLAAICAGPPRTFEEGLQLFWFLWRARQFAYTSCIGRMDVFLRPLYERTVHTPEERAEALELVCEIWEKLNSVGSGDTLMNAMLGGVDEDGRDISCDLSLLFMEATMKVAKSEPHINVRIHGHTWEPFLQKAMELISMGQGHGVQYHDEFHIPALVEHGVPLELARLYGNDGCTELTIDGKSGIQFWQTEMVKTLELALFRGKENPSRPHKKVHKWTHNRPADYFHSQLDFGFDSGDPLEADSYEAFYALFLRQLSHQLDGFLARIDEKIREDKETDANITSPLVAGGLPLCLDRGIDPLRGGFEVDNYQLLSGSIPTTADSLMAVKEAVFDRKYCTMAELLEALPTDFSGKEDLRARLLQAPKYGNGHDEVDAIAAGLAEFFLDAVDNHKAPHNIRIWPGIYNIDFHMFASALGATPDGRHSGDMICDHYSPTPGRAVKGPTAVLRSAAKANLHRGCASSPVYVTLPAGPDMGTADTIRSLTMGIRTLKLPLVSIAVNDREALEDAMEHPERHEDLVVRVWGYNARFIDLDRNLQLHVLNRIL